VRDLSHQVKLRIGIGGLVVITRLAHGTISAEIHRERATRVGAQCNQGGIGLPHRHCWVRSTTGHVD
jgi:hypothetical protein